MQCALWSFLSFGQVNGLLESGIQQSCPWWYLALVGSSRLEALRYGIKMQNYMCFCGICVQSKWRYEKEGLDALVFKKGAGI